VFIIVPDVNRGPAGEYKENESAFWSGESFIPPKTIPTYPVSGPLGTFFVWFCTKQTKQNEKNDNKKKLSSPTLFRTRYIAIPNTFLITKLQRTSLIFKAMFSQTYSIHLTQLGSREVNFLAANVNFPGKR